VTNDNNSIPSWLNQCAQGVIEHMNQDHSNTIVSTLYAQFGIKDAKALMVELRIDGYFVVSCGQQYFLTFEKSCDKAEEYKLELVNNAKRYREFEIPLN
jgi:putative heme iron utilization protein